ncbi:S1/P1 nuclease [Lutimonas halocynthiae]|uniref:S1/P1 nuclease n=1 Tax=Lutimonas halocynthiae TaxID=1446477 RepID=UPI0025B3BC59|nr:S1/P1 nuclease [Lutimonas halocynthiae]MDN3643511.1 S1/P1 nuclease [Lutimonas halocynthiae]
MKNFFLLLTLSFIFNTSYAVNKPDWGSTGHRAIGEIAEFHLSKKAKKEIEKLLGGQGLALVSTFGDDIKSDDAYDKYYTWHFVNFPFDTKYEDSKINKRGDIVIGIDHCIDVLKDPNASEQDKVFFLKFLVHLIGDLHQPLHVGREEDRGGNDIKLEWHRKKSNLHRVWDSEMISFYNMSYSELVSNRKKLSKAQVESIQKGSILDWTYESQGLAKKVYASAKPEAKLSYRYSYDHFEVVTSQLQKSGIRLAKVLNDIFI